ncbi:MAG: DUF116 domain-containing protein [Candidatus Cloacimonetes bacterium]|nr:DUF116 domain-containing protein [Candidatus Cloacimonadota bacterium]
MSNNKNITKYQFLLLSVIGLIILMAVITGLWYFISPRLHEFNETLPFFLLSALRIFFVILIIGTVLVLLTSIFEKNFLIANFAVKLFIKIVYPIVIFLGSILGMSKAELGESFIKVNDSLVRALKPKYKAEDVIILLPHCLQDTDCPIRITVDVKNCKNCGKCTIGKILEIANQYNISVFVATGGTLARRIIAEQKPKLIVAVACYRDLVSGIQDAFPIKTFGIINERPFGPCVNTTVSIKEIKSTLKKVIKH